MELDNRRDGRTVRPLNAGVVLYERIAHTRSMRPVCPTLPRFGIHRVEADEMDSDIGLKWDNGSAWECQACSILLSEFIEP